MNISAEKSSTILKIFSDNGSPCLTPLEQPKNPAGSPLIRIEILQIGHDNLEEDKQEQKLKETN